MNADDDRGESGSIRKMRGASLWRRELVKRARDLAVPSLIVSFLGDSIAPRGANVALSAIAEVLGVFDIDNGATRTALSRLATEKWVSREKVGRNAFYALTPLARAQSQAASRRIYNLQEAENCGWRLYLTGGLAPSARRRARAGLERIGAGQLDVHTFVLPTTAPHPEESHGETLQVAAMDPLQAKAFVKTYFDLTGLADEYRRFARDFAVFARLGASTAPTGLEAAALRTLLIHRWRRIILRDPRLPRAYAPKGWPGFAARDLAAQIWRDVFESSESWLDDNALSAFGAPSPRARDAPCF